MKLSHLLEPIFNSILF